MNKLPIAGFMRHRTAIPWLELPKRRGASALLGRVLGDEDRLVFVHMEKTAGSAVHECLATLFPDHQICKERFGGISERDSSYLGRYRFFSAHASLDEFRNIPDRRFFVTFLRDPVARLISAYRFWSSAKRNYIERAGLEISRLCKDKTLPEFLSEETIHRFPFLWNTYAQRLSGEVTIDPGTAFRSRSGEILERALTNLDNLDGLGLAEEVDLSFVSICHALGMTNPYDGRIVNTTAGNSVDVPDDYEQPNDVAINQETLDAVHKFTTLDQIIYNRAAERLFGELRAGLSYFCRPAATLLPVVYRGEEWLQQSGDGACVMFGPYLKLPPGSYWITVEVKRSRTAVGTSLKPFALLEICCDYGDRILRQRRLTNADVDRENGTIRMLLHVDKTVDNVEIRLFSSTSRTMLVRRRIVVATA